VRQDRAQQAHLLKGYSRDRGLILAIARLNYLLWC
jgi:hypothetical protein